MEQFTLMETEPTQRELENRRALGGMRNPHISVSRLPNTWARGRAVSQLLTKAQKLWPNLTGPAKAILSGKEPKDLPLDVVHKMRDIILNTLWDTKPRQRTAKATTPLQSQVIAGWKGDPDSETLATWLDHGAPMGFTVPITCNGIFPEVQRSEMASEGETTTLTSLEGWSNYASAVEENEELQKLIEDYVTRGFCHLETDPTKVKDELGRDPIVNKLGVITKTKEEHGKITKKSRIIWDMRRSGANTCCNQGERILLPRLLDVAAGILEGMRNGQECWMACIDIKDAFMNIPIMAERYAVTAAKPKGDPNAAMEYVIFDTLVFGAASSPTIWGRFASWLARTTCTIEPRAAVQVYVDDPIYVLRGEWDSVVEQLTNILLWTAISGFPVKLAKAAGGKKIQWVGAQLQVHNETKTVEITIPKDKIEKVQTLTDKYLSRPVVGCKELRSYVGTLSFIAGLIPHLRPFLSSLWSVLSGPHEATNDGAAKKGFPGKLIHVRRIRPALAWIRALLQGEAAPLRRELPAFLPTTIVDITTDACPFGLGGTLRVAGKLVSVFASDIPPDALKKFSARRGDSKHTTLWEALALLVACRLWLPSFKGQANVRCRSDSLSLLLSLVKGRAKSADLAVLAREFSLDQAQGDYRLHLLTHIPGVTNLEADALSRQWAPVPLDLPESVRTAPRAEVLVDDNFWKVRT